MKRQPLVIALALALVGVLLASLVHKTDAASLPAAKDVPANPTFNKDVAPIVFANCSGCHHAGEVAPFSLMTYDEVKKKGQLSSHVMADHVMPPWKAEPGYGDFLDARVLSEQQIAVFDKWVENGMPEGDAKDLPPAPKFDNDGWQLGKPDLVVKMPEAYTLAADGRDVMRGFVLPVELPEDKYVKAVEFHPGNRKVVHHALIFLDNSGRARQLAAASQEKEPGVPGYKAFGGVGFLPSGSLGGWAPGVRPRPLPEGVARPLKKGTDIVVQLHLHPSGKVEQEQCEIGIYFADKPPTRALVGLTMGSLRINIEPGNRDYKVTDSVTLPVDVDAWGIIPHAHLICKEIKCDATLPDGKIVPLLWIKDWDWNWQDHYWYAKPIPLPKGTVINTSWVYDNSDENPHNPNKPAKKVKFGEQTADEMAILWINVMPHSLNDVGPLTRASLGKPGAFLFGDTTKPGQDPAEAVLDAAMERRPAFKAQVLKQFDHNGNGVLDPDEKKEAIEFFKTMLGDR